MKVLVTGSSGFIGTAVSAELKARGHEMIAFDKPRDVRGPITGCGSADAIINLAGMLGTPELFGSERKAAEVNILGALNVYDVAADLDIPVVQIGTGHKGQPNPYAITKGCAEDLGLARAQWLGEKISVVRAYHVYGPGQAVGPPHGKASVHKFFPTFACRVLTGMPVELCGSGQQLIDPVHVSDTARVLVDAIAGPYGELAEAGTGVPVTVSQVALDIMSLTSAWTGLRLTEPRAGEPLNARVVAETPLCSDHPWPYLVPEAIEWYRQWLVTA